MGKHKQNDIRFKDDNGVYHYANSESPQWHFIAGQRNVEIYDDGKWHKGWED